MSRFTFACAALLLTSGVCALVDETLWLRALRAVFGASTPASAATLAVLMGGMGAGGIFFGRFAEQVAKPLLLYAALEAVAAVSAAASPFLIDGARALYLHAGGSAALGIGGGSVVRVLLTVLALGIPAFVMGGTFPAVARAAASAADPRRRGLALLYGANTTGAVVGAVAATFALLDITGVRHGIWLASAGNALIAVAALALSTRTAARAPSAPTASSASIDSPWPKRAILGAAFASGGAFLLLEIVWYRIAAPLLGGSTYSFGVILAVALAGVGAGGLLYAMAPPRRATMSALALTFALEATFVVLPCALGDRIARAAFFVREMTIASFSSLALGWVAIAAVLVLPAAIVSGYQFSLLLALRGEGDHDAASDSGTVYGANTIGSIAGSLFGGFGALPLLGAVTTWKLAALVLVAACAPFLVAALLDRGRRVAAAPSLLCAAAALWCCTATGPTALWRHVGIGAGRGDMHAGDAMALDAQERTYNRFGLDERDGIESSLSVRAGDGIALIVNGKSDGSTTGDAATMIGLSLLPPLVRGAPPKSSFIVGLGTGESVGWLAAVPGVENVTVAEIEPGVVDFAVRAHEANLDAIANPKVHVQFGDAREVLATSREKFDFIASEPSNPYRAGVAGLYTRDFYDDARAHLNEGGVIAQWIQSYEVDVDAVRIAAATLESVMPYVSMWELGPTDILLIGTDTPQTIDAAAIGAQLKQEPYATAFGRVFRSSGLEGFLALHRATPAFVRTLVEGAPQNSDDRPLLELSFAHTVGHRRPSPLFEIEQAAIAAHEDLPDVKGAFDRDRVVAERRRSGILAGGSASGADDDVEGFWETGDIAAATRALARPETPPFFDATGLMVRAHLASLTKATPDDRAALAESLARLDQAGYPAEAALIHLEATVTDVDSTHEDDVVNALRSALDASRVDPWLPRRLTSSAFVRLGNAPLGQASALAALKLVAAGPLAGLCGETERVHVMHQLAVRATTSSGPPAECLQAYEAVEPWPFWDPDWLAGRLRCYEAHRPARAAEAAADLARVRAQQPKGVSEVLGR